MNLPELSVGTGIAGVSDEPSIGAPVEAPVEAPADASIDGLTDASVLMPRIGATAGIAPDARAPEVDTPTAPFGVVAALVLSPGVGVTGDIR